MMRKASLAKIIAIFSVVLISLSSCNDDREALAPAPPGDYSFTEEFDTVKSAWDRGWRFMNRSFPAGRLWVNDPSGFPTFPFTDIQYFNPGWEQGNAAWFPAYSSKSTAHGYISASWASNANFPVPATADELTGQYINNWMVSPTVMAKNGDKIIFYSRCDTACRLQVRINKTTTDFLNVGRTLADAGDFSSLLLDVNPTYGSTGFNNWTRFEATVYGLDKPTEIRFGFRYMISDGFTGNVWPTNDAAVLYGRLAKSVIGIDKVQFISSK